MSVASYAAIGDSFSEGMGDELPNGTLRGVAKLALLQQLFQIGAQYVLVLPGQQMLLRMGIRCFEHRVEKGAPAKIRCPANRALP